MDQFLIQFFGLLKFSEVSAPPPPPPFQNPAYATANNRGGVEDTRLEAKAKDTKKIRGQGQGQGQPFRAQTLLRPGTGMLEAKDQGHKRKCSPKKRSSQKFFKRSPQKNVFQKFFNRSTKF